MSTEEKSSGQVVRNIAMTLGNDVTNTGIPFLLAVLMANQAARIFTPDFSGLIRIGLIAGLSIPLYLVLAHLLAGINGRRILRAIEKDYGPKTRQHVLTVFATTKPGERLVLDIPAFARANGEAPAAERGDGGRA